MRIYRPLITCLGFALLWLGPSVAASDAPGMPDGWYLPVGLNIGASIHEPDSGGFLLGAEASLAHFEKMIWYGLYLDGVGDLGPDVFRVSTGAEAGIGILGIELGYLGQIGDGDVAHGFRLGGVLTICVFSLYGRWGHLAGDTSDANFAEFGILAKYPFTPNLF